MCSAIASTTNVRSSRPSDRSVVIRTRSGGRRSSNFEHTFATERSARSADASDRAHSVTSPWRAAHAASPQAIVPDPDDPEPLRPRRDGAHARTASAA